MVTVTVYLDKSVWYSPSGEISGTRYHPKIWHPVRLKVEMAGRSFLASAIHYKCIFFLQLRKPEARGVEIWPKVTLAARCFP